MKRELPIQTRKSLEVVGFLKKAGIGFVPMPILSEDDRIALLEQVQSRLEHMIGEKLDIKPKPVVNEQKRKWAEALIRLEIVNFNNNRRRCINCGRNASCDDSLEHGPGCAVDEACKYLGGLEGE